MVDLSRFVVCGTCGDLFETSPQPGFPTPQRCGCQRRDTADPGWNRYDFNEHLHLCRCCRSEALPSGSRWSVWFCGECKERVLALNRAVGRAVVPIGRHSLMSGAGLRGSDVAGADAREATRLIAGFHAATVELFGGMERLRAFARRRTDELRAGLGYGAAAPVPLPEWLARLSAASHSDPERFGKRVSFERLVASLHEAEQS